MRFTLSALLLGFLFDLAVGDPQGLYHPVQAVGMLISFWEKLLRRLFPKTRGGELLAGVFLVILVTGISTAVPALLVYGAGKIHRGLAFGLCTLFSYQLLATRSLKDESMKVYRQLEMGDLPEARKAVSMIVGRDTKGLNQEGVAKAAIETVAENTSDGVIAPLLFLALGGPVLGFFYKSINTMDSMVGYKNETYLYFGRAAAKLDDWVNYIPARLSAFLMIAATIFTSFDTGNAWRIYRRDKRNHASPNSAHTEAVMAGALGLQLAGNAFYFGKLYEKPTIGDKIKEVEAEDIRRANVLMYATALLTMSLAVLLFVAWDLGRIFL
ncbi:MAG: cobalamin biosynthesis protein CobD [Lachnospiraceae bacterium]|nr:cobalamin biosynthesis protein CobD [Lachnospiraceae bacterium]